MKYELILPVLVILIVISSLCLYGEEISMEVKNISGDIEVHAHGCKPPPYENGLLLLLNRMPNKEDTARFEGFISFLRAEENVSKWFEMIEDTFPNINTEERNYLMTIASGESILLTENNKMTFTMLNIRKAVSDSLGYYTFIDIPPGLYQIICSTNQKEKRIENQSQSMRK